MAKALAAGAVMVAAALPLVAATGAGAATAHSATSYLQLTQATVGGQLVPATPGADGVTPIFGAGWSGAGTFYFDSTDTASLAGTVQNVTVTTTATGVTFSGSAETAAPSPTVTTSISSTTTVTPGFYPVTITDSAGSVTIPNAFYVEAAPTITSISPATLPSNATGVTVTVTGTGFVSHATGSIKNSAGVSIGTLAYATSTTMTATVNTTGASGFYGVSITNGDGATASSSTVGVTVSGPTITSISPSSVAIPSVSVGSATTTLTITGTGFQTGAYVAITPTSSGTGASVGVSTVASATSITVPLTVTAYSTGTTPSVAGTWGVTVHNPDGSTAFLAGGIGVGVASLAAPVITAVSALPVLSASGATASAVITGSGFGPAGSSVTVLFSSAAGTDNDVVCASPTVISDSQVSCLVTVTGGAYAGAHSVTVQPAGGTTSAAFANAVTISGPVITSVSPSTIPAGFVGTLTLTGTGFTVGNASATVTDSTVSGTAGDVACSSTTSCSVKITASTLPAGTSVVIVLTDGSLIPTAFAVSAAVVTPTISSVIYPSGTTTGGVGQSATNAQVTIVGTGFLPGATVTFTDAGTSATVVTVTPTAIVANVSTTSTAASNTFTVTNTNGGYKLSGFNFQVNAVTAISVSPSSYLAGATAATMTITGSGFSSATKLVASSSLITLGTMTVVSATTITVPVTVAAVNGTTTVNWTLTVTNADGGTSSASLTVNPGVTVTGTYYVPTFSTNTELNVTGTGFQQGMTVASSNTDYSVEVAQVNTAGTVATLLVTTTSGATSGTSSNVTFTNPDGSTVTFTINGGPVPTPAKTFTLKRVVGVAVAGRTRIMRIYGTGFYGRPTVRSNAGGTRAIVIHDNGKMLTLRVTVRANVRKGTHVFTVILKNGQRNHINYLQR